MGNEKWCILELDVVKVFILIKGKLFIKLSTTMTVSPSIPHFKVIENYNVQIKIAPVSIVS